MSGKSLEQRFNELCQIIQTLPKNGIFEPTNETKLKFYSYFKQATVGPVVGTQPYFYQVVERAKWDAWKSVEGMSKEECMQAYIDEMKESIKPALEEHADNELMVKILSLVNP